MLQKLEKYISIIVYIYFRIKYIPEEGLEPSPFKDKNLNLARLPIPSLWLDILLIKTTKEYENVNSIIKNNGIAIHI